MKYHRNLMCRFRGVESICGRRVRTHTTFFFHFLFLTILSHTHTPHPFIVDINPEVQTDSFRDGNADPWDDGSSPFYPGVLKNKKDFAIC